METITSRQNPLCTHLRKLAASASYRRRCGEFLCDSPKLLEEALLWQGALHTVISTDQVPLPPIPAGVRHVRVPEDVMGSVSPAQTPQGVLSVCGMPERPLPEKLTGTRYMVLDGVQDPGNVGTILRTADAFRSDGLLLVNGCADLYNPKTVRATMGAVLRGNAGGAAGDERSAALWCRAAQRYCGRPGGGLPPLRRGHRQRGPGAFPGGPGPLRQDGPYPHE